MSSVIWVISLLNSSCVIKNNNEVKKLERQRINDIQRPYSKKCIHKKIANIVIIDMQYSWQRPSKPVFLFAAGKVKVGIMTM